MKNLKYISSHLKKPLLLILSFLCLETFIYGQIGPGVGADTHDPKVVIAAAKQALAKVRNVSYKATYQGTGAFSTHAPNVKGEVTIEKLDFENSLKAKFAASGQFFQTGSDEKQNFHTTFDGTTVYKLRPKENAVLQKELEINNPTERKFGFVTSFFGGGAYQLTMFEFIESEPLNFQVQAEIADYEGRTVIDETLCHVVYIEYLRNERKVRERWFFGVKDSLPRKYELLETDDKGKFGSYVLTIADLKTDIKTNPSSYKIITPKGYTVKLYEPPSRPVSLAVDSTAPEWKMFDAANREHSLQDYRGKILVLDFWATWCNPCIKAMPDLQKIQDKFKSRGVEVFGVNVWEESNAAAYMKQRGFTYTLLLKGEEAAKLYGVSSLPSLFIIGVDGKIIYHATGLPKDVENFLENYLKKIETK